MRTALFHGVGGDRVLELKPLAQRLLRDAERTATAGAKLVQLVQAIKPPKTTRFGGTKAGIPSADAYAMPAELRESMLKHSDVVKRVYDYSRESGAWIPLAQDRRTQTHVANRIKTLQRSVDRVVNVGFV